jgi:hypothetical protein
LQHNSGDTIPPACMRSISLAKCTQPFNNALSRAITRHPRDKAKQTYHTKNAYAALPRICPAATYGDAWPAARGPQLQSLCRQRLRNSLCNCRIRALTIGISITFLVAIWPFSVERQTHGADLDKGSEKLELGGRQDGLARDVLIAPFMWRRCELPASDLRENIAVSEGEICSITVRRVK